MKMEIDGRPGNATVQLERMAARRIMSANYITSVNGMLHPDRILPEHDFLYLLDGTWEIWVDGDCYDMQTDDLLILPAGLHHWGEKLCSPGNRHMYFHVLPTGAERRAALSGEKQESCSAEKGKTAAAQGGSSSESEVQGKGNFMDRMEEKESDFAKVPLLLHCEREPRVRQYFQELISAYWSQDLQRANRLTLFFNLILTELEGLRSGGVETTVSDSILEEVCRRIYSNPQVFYSAKEMAEQFFICPRTLNNYFQRACGRTFPAYQMEVKLEMVREFLLLQPEAKLHEAAVNFGFYDEFHLSKAFRKKYGEPPSRLRKRDLEYL